MGRSGGLFDISPVTDLRRAMLEARCVLLKIRSATVIRGLSRQMLLRLRSDLAADRVIVAYRRLIDLKGGFREDQPRWPRGIGENSGRWSGGAGAAPAADGRAARRRLGGHHFVPKEVFNEQEFSLGSEARRVFDDGTTGPLPGGGNNWSVEYYQYNRAVREQLRQFLSERGTRGSDMSVDQATEFLQRVKGSSDPRIRSFNLRIYRLQIMYFLRYGPAGRE